MLVSEIQNLEILTSDTLVFENPTFGSVFRHILNKVSEDRTLECLKSKVVRISDHVFQYLQ